MRSPYLVGPAAFGRNFYGRALLVEQLLDPDQTCVYLVGNRRSGKTSVLHQVEEQTEVVPLFANLQRTGLGARNLGAVLVRQIEEVRSRFPALQHVRCEPTSDACAVIDDLARVAAQHQLTILLLWDEGEKLLEMGSGDLECLRGALHDRPQVRTILAATPRLARELARHPGNTSPFLHGFATAYLPPLSVAEALELIRQPNSKEGTVRVADQLAGQIIELTGRQPYLIQHLCQRLFVSDGSLRSIEADDLLVDESLGNVFEIDYNSLMPAEQAILWHLACVPDAAESQQLIRLEAARQQLYGLQQLGLIHREGERYQIANYYLQAWLQLRRTPVPADSDTTGFEWPFNSPAKSIAKNNLPLPENSTLPTPDIQALRLDTAVPEQVFVQQPFDLAVAVRQRSSPALTADDLLRTASGEVQLVWPTESPVIRLKIEVSAPDCHIVDKPSQSFRLLSGKDSPVFYFHLVPQREGELSVFVTVYQDDDVLGSARVHTHAVDRRQPAGQVLVTVTSQALEPSPAQLASLQRQLDAARENLNLIIERKAEYVLGVDVPLQLIKEERYLLNRIVELELQLDAG